MFKLSKGNDLGISYKHYDFRVKRSKIKVTGSQSAKSGKRELCTVSSAKHVGLVKTAVNVTGLQWNRFIWTIIQETSSVAHRATEEWRLAMNFHDSDWMASSVTRRSSRCSALTFGTSRQTSLWTRLCRRCALTGMRITPSVDQTPQILSRAPSRSTTSVLPGSPFSRWCEYYCSFIRNECNQIKQKEKRDKTQHIHASRGWCRWPMPTWPILT